MTNQRYKKIQYIIRRLQHHMQVCDEIHDEETMQRQNFGANMEAECDECSMNEEYLRCSFEYLQEAITQLQKIDP